jgi:hypothetical protein
MALTKEKAKFLGIKAVKVWGLVALYISLSRTSTFWRIASREMHADYSHAIFSR